MLLVAIILALFAVMAGCFLWLEALASKAALQERYPDYAGKIYRPVHRVITRQGGPVRMLALIGTTSPDPRDHRIARMRVLALICVGSGALSVLFWACA
ncbi:hypothetical protein [Roseateles chitosanitabidus]|uniref:hypothetical protein n=1 Tax=Roseateles chitosanitabidus TaxID=65048 RepID=UPI0011DFDEC5|nr:hypothetical protein [Roseateles chitosanitabidus]